jgi:hypothetical protein
VRVREAMARVAPVGGERWRLITLTIPTLTGVGLKQTLEVFNCAWSLFRKRAWWAGLIKAGIKGEEFTLGDEKRLKREQREWSADSDGYHVHVHVLVISEWVAWLKLGEEWTACLKKAAEKNRVPLAINTAHGRAVVDVRLVVEGASGAKGTISRNGAVEEVCKYITKAESWLQIPEQSLCEVVKVLRGRRMVDLLGQCNERRGSHSGRQPRKTEAERIAEKEAAARAEFIERGRVEQTQWLSDDPRAGDPLANPELRDWREVPVTYLDTQNTIDGGETAGKEKDTCITAKRKRRRPLRLLGAELIASGKRAEWLELLASYVFGVQEYRRAMLSCRFAYATFSTLDGQRWYGLRANPASSFAQVARTS